jgi:hypothetical protein
MEGVVMTPEPGYHLRLRVPVVEVRLPGVGEQELRQRLLRLGCYLSVLSDPDFREFGRALMAAVEQAPPSD